MDSTDHTSGDLASHGSVRSATSDARFDRCNLEDLELEETVAHGGRGMIRFRRIATAAEFDGACNFIDVSVVPPDCSIGRHTHGPGEEEYYLILEGSGAMWTGERWQRVRAGDLVRNPPGGTHELVNDGTADLRLFVFELRVP
jgi:mannose-6-phosphate isomerase-like protein (cupin superfamily)